MRREVVDVLIVGSGAGGGTVASRLAPLAASGARVLVVERGPRLEPPDFTGDELTMSPALYEDAGGFLTADGTMTLAFGRTWGGSTTVYTGTSLHPPARVIDGWGVPGLSHADLAARSARYAEENHVHLLPEEEINDNNRLFQRGCETLGWDVRQFPVNVKGCRGSSLCNLGCPNQAKQGTAYVQLPAAEAAGVERATRAEVVRLRPATGADVQAAREAGDGVRVEPVRAIAEVVVHPGDPGGKGAPPEWEPGRYEIAARTVVVAGGSVGSTALLLRSGFGDRLPRLGHAFTCHPAFILVAEHPEPLTNDVGHPKSFYLDRADEEGWILETCMYFPFVTAKNLTGFGPDHSALMRAFDRLQMILVLAADAVVPENRIEVDADGRPVVRYTFTAAVRESLAAATRAAARIFFAAGAERVHAPLADPPLLGRDAEGDLDRRIRAEHFLPGRTSISAAHLMGGCAMGSDAGDSVTDDRGRVHGVPWLRVADSSLFPASVEINPYLTVMALADRVAEGVLEEMS